MKFNVSVLTCIEVIGISFCRKNRAQFSSWVTVLSSFVDFHLHTSMNNSLFSIANELQSVAAMLCQLQLYTGRECRSQQLIAFVCYEIIAITSMIVFLKICCCLSFPFSKFLYFCYWLRGTELYDAGETANYILVIKNLVKIYF